MVVEPKGCTGLGTKDLKVPFGEEPKKMQGDMQPSVICEQSEMVTAKCELSLPLGWFEGGAICTRWLCECC